MVLSHIFELLLSSCSQIRKLGVKLFPSQNEVHGRNPNVVEWAFSGNYDPDTVVRLRLTRKASPQLELTFDRF